MRDDHINGTNKEKANERVRDCVKTFLSLRERVSVCE